MDEISGVQSLLNEAIGQYFPLSSGIFSDAVNEGTQSVDRRCTFTPCVGGINNMMFYVDDIQDKCVHSFHCSSPDYHTNIRTNSRYVLRIYNNGRNDDKVFFEHKVLLFIQEIQLDLQLDVSFQYPRLIQSLTGESSVLLSNNVRAAVFEHIPGQLASQQDLVEPIGIACGYTCYLLQHVTDKFTSIELESFPTPPYYDLYRGHHTMNRALFYNEISSNIYDNVREQVLFLTQQMLLLEDKLSYFHTLNLPKQVIHGDLHFNNILHTEGKVTGVLDFEFVSYDWRAMDFAINISSYCSTPDPMSLIETFVAGYVRHGKLSKQEIECIPDLVKLRILNNVVFFVGRAYSGEGSCDFLIGRCESYVTRINWLIDNHDRIINVLKVYFLNQYKASHES